MTTQAHVNLALMDLERQRMLQQRTKMLKSITTKQVSQTQHNKQYNPNQLGQHPNSIERKPRGTDKEEKEEEEEHHHHQKQTMGMPRQL